MKSINMTRREVLAAAGATGAMAALAGCGGSGSSSSSSGGSSAASKELNAYVVSSLATLDPQNDSNSDDREMTNLMGEGLFRYGSDGTTPEPAVCESYTVSDDGLTYTFTLGTSKWQDGTNVVAGDFVYGIKRLFGPELASENASSYLTYIKGASEAYNGEGSVEDIAVSAPDDKTLVVTLISVLPEVTVKGFFTGSFVYPMNQAAIEKGGDGWSTNPETHLSNGLYKLSEYNPDESVVLVKNDAYAGTAEAGVADKITFKLFADSSAADVAMGNGELDVYKYASDSLVSQLGDNVQVKNAELLATASLFMNWNCKPLDDVNVRKAIFLAVDASYTNDTLENGNATVAEGLVSEAFSDPKGGTFRTSSNAVIDNGGDALLDQAKQALADAGYPNGEGMPKLVYLTSNTTRGNQRAEFFQAMLKDNLGIQVEVGSYDIPTYLSMLTGSDYAFSYVSQDASCDNVEELMSGYTTAADQFGISIPAYDDLMAQAAAATEANKQSELLHQAEEVLIKENYALRPVLYGYSMNAYGKDVTNIVTDPAGTALYQFMGKSSW